MIEIAKNNLYQLNKFLNKIDHHTYKINAKILGGGTIGQHMRHILEFYLLFIEGYKTGEVCYDNRKRDQLIEIDCSYAKQVLNSIIDELPNIDLNTPIQLTTDLSNDCSQQHTILTSPGRELIYCIEHSIHHQALIKAALISFGVINLTDNTFGVAFSTLRNQNK